MQEKNPLNEPDRGRHKHTKEIEYPTIHKNEKARHYEYDTDNNGNLTNVSYLLLNNARCKCKILIIYKSKRI